MMKRFLVYVMAIFYFFAGINHFWHPDGYVKIMPTYLPYHLPLVYISGVIESLLGLLLIPKKTRRLAAWLVIALLIAVFPANIQMAVDFWKEKNAYLWVAILRLPLQVVLIWWAWIYTRNQKK